MNLFTYTRHFDQGIAVMAICMARDRDHAKLIFEKTFDDDDCYDKEHEEETEEMYSHVHEYTLETIEKGVVIIE